MYFTRSYFTVNYFTVPYFGTGDDVVHSIGMLVNFGTFMRRS